MTKSDESLTHEGDNFVVKQPLKLYRSKKRRYVRLDISAPISFAPIDIDRPLETIDVNQYSGTILNISGGGVLFACKATLQEDSFITMSLEFLGRELLTGITGKVKRVDEDGEGGYLVGIEFCSESELISVFGSANIGSVISSFDERVKRFLLKYIFVKKVDERAHKKEQK